MNKESNSQEFECEERKKPMATISLCITGILCTTHAHKTKTNKTIQQ
jgi:hypothetical protein